MPSITLLIGWKPRLGRQSAYFPGERSETEKAASWEIAGKAEQGLLDSGKSFKCDLDRGPLVLSVKAYSPKETDVKLLRLILTTLHIDESATLPKEAEARLKADRLANKFVKEKGYRDFQIVMIPEPSKDGVYIFTVFHNGSKDNSKPGLIQLKVIPDKEKVEELQPQ